MCEWVFSHIYSCMHIYHLLPQYIFLVPINDHSATSWCSLYIFTIYRLRPTLGLTGVLTLTFGMSDHVIARYALCLYVSKSAAWVLTMLVHSHLSPLTCCWCMYVLILLSQPLLISAHFLLCTFFNGNLRWHACTSWSLWARPLFGE